MGAKGELSYDLAIDVGCMHNLRGDDLLSYAAGVARLVRPTDAESISRALADLGDAA